MLTKWLCLILIFLPVCVTQAQQQIYSERGNYYFKNYSVREYKGSLQNWGALQDKQGVMYFANGDGVLSFDGKRWTLIETPTESVIRSMVIDDSGRIFVGALDDFGYLARAADGSLVYKSLLPMLKPELHGMGNIWNTYAHDELIYFEAETGLFCWNGESFRFWPWPDPARYHKSFFWKSELYLYEYGAGLLRLSGDTFQPATGGGAFKDMRIYAAVPAGKNNIILATKFDGLFLYDGQHVTAFKTPADKYFRENYIYTGILLRDSAMAFGTRLGGVIIIDQHGAVRSLITKANGLTTNNVYALATDRAGDLWLALEAGISHVEISNGLSFYNDMMGIESAINDVCRYNGKLYIATSTGVYFLRPARLPETQASFEKVDLGKSDACWSFSLVSGRLLVASVTGTFEINGDATRTISSLPSFDIHVYRGDSSRILIAHENDLQSLKLVSGQWKEAVGVKDLRLDNIKFTESQAGKVWISTFSQGAALISFDVSNGKVNYDKYAITRFGVKEGLPEGFIKINTIGKRPLFKVGSESKLLRFNDVSNHFEMDTAFRAEYNLGNEEIFPVSDQDASGEFLVKTKRKDYGVRQIIRVSPRGNSYATMRFDMSRIFDNVGVITYQENKDLIWHVGNGIMVRQELNKVSRDTTFFNAYLNRIILSDDSIFFNNTFDPPQGASFPNAWSALRFEFTSSNLVAEETNMFQHKLEGYDGDWSAWSNENVKEYSRLWEGDYTFLVRARNYAGKVSEPFAFHFKVSPPWFRSYLAYAIYLLAFLGVLWAFARWRSYQLRQEREALRTEIGKQTLEIRQQNSQLEEQAEELRVNAEQLKELDKLKSTFFINISHEFRSPLSLILGPLEKFIEDKDPGKIRVGELERMHRNAWRLQQLINQLLDLARLESGGMKIAEQRSDLIYFLRVLTASFESLAELRNISYEVEIPRHAYVTLFDIDKVETVLYNLLSNAFKFTPSGGRINFKVILPGDVEDMVTIIIADTGPGIPPAELDKIFDRFYQVDSSSSRAYEGSGIGLSLVRELVSLMNGRVAVQSELKSGSTFTVLLPMKGVQLDAHDDRALNEEIDQHEILHEDELAIARSEGNTSEALVLLIEDNEDLRTYLRENLEGDYEVVTAENGQAGLEKALDLAPDLILSDMMMPLMDGFTLCTRIRADERTSHIPFILLTARAAIESKLEGLELGADEYMTKPFNIREVKARIKNLLEQRKGLRKSFSREVTIQPKNIAVTSVDERFLNHALAIMEAHLGDEQFSVEKFAGEIGMSRKNLLRKIKALTDQSVNEFIRKFRLTRAAQLLDARSGTVSEIAYQVGFNNLSYFSKCFKEFHGVLPNEYLVRKS